ncbi:MAG: sensor histidine kinase [Acidimicrobiia bacterium]
MDLGRIRLRLTVYYGVLSALAVGVLAVLAVRASSAQIAISAEREAERAVTELEVGGQFRDGSPGAYNTWLVNVGERRSVPLGETWVEPPLQRIAELTVARQEPVSERYREDGSYLLYARAVAETEVLVTALTLDSFDGAASATRLRILLAALAATSAATAASWWLAGRSLGPARVAMAQQRDFITDAAHELRTPLSVIQAAAGHALLRDQSPSAYRQALDEVRTAADRARIGVDELLELARLQAGQVSLRRGPLRLDLLMEEVAAGIRVDGCTIDAPLGEPTVVDGDYALLRQATETVTRNAASRAGKVTLTVESVGNEVAIVVADDGPGFPDALLGDAAFERFLRGDSKGSTGLGLAIAARIVRLHDGRCSAVNRPGGGAEVRLVLNR